jgi:hypothetical protein
MNRPDRQPQPLKAKQRALLAVFQRLGPITIKRAALEIHGDTSDTHVKMVHNQMPALASRKLVTPAGVADHPPGVRGVRPLLWRACA